MLWRMIYISLFFTLTIGCRQATGNGDKESAEPGFAKEISNKSTNKTMQDSIRMALQYQRETYPSSQLRDVYKNFMQDFFGPGHILNDTAAAAGYLRRELAETARFEGPDYEPTGFRGNFYRVNLRLISEGTIPYSIFFNTFVNSVQSVATPDSAYWMQIWDAIDTEIAHCGWKFENEADDRSEMEKQFKEGDFVVHHSEAYNKAVNFHYRIIGREAFEKEIRPLLEKR